jgi:hypothetical protein
MGFLRIKWDLRYLRIDREVMERGLVNAVI